MAVVNIATLPEYKQVCEYIHPIYANIIFSYLTEIRIDYFEPDKIYWKVPIIYIRKEYGIIHGIFKKYYYSGVILEETPYINGKIHGLVKKYYENGKIKRETPYLNDKKHGIQIKYNELDERERNIYFYGFLIFEPRLRYFFLRFKDYIYTKIEN
jgi:hypothetical protein